MTGELDATEDRLRRDRPAPAIAWRHELLRFLRARPIPPPRPANLWLLICLAAAAGGVLLVVAALLI